MVQTRERRPWREETPGPRDASRGSLRRCSRNAVSTALNVAAPHHSRHPGKVLALRVIRHTSSRCWKHMCAIKRSHSGLHASAAPTTASSEGGDGSSRAQGRRTRQGERPSAPRWGGIQGRGGGPEVPPTDRHPRSPTPDFPQRGVGVPPPAQRPASAPRSTDIGRLSGDGPALSDGAVRVRCGPRPRSAMRR